MKTHFVTDTIRETVRKIRKDLKHLAANMSIPQFTVYSEFPRSGRANQHTGMKIGEAQKVESSSGLLGKGQRAPPYLSAKKSGGAR